MNDDFDNDDWLNDGDEPSDDSEDQDDAQDFDWLLDESDDSDPDQQAGRLGVTGELSWLQDSGQSADDTGEGGDTAPFGWQQDEQAEAPDSRLGVTSELSWLQQEGDIESQLEAAEAAGMDWTPDDAADPVDVPPWLQGLDADSEDDSLEEEAVFGEALDEEFLFADSDMDTGELIDSGDLFSHEKPEEPQDEGLPDWLTEAEDLGEAEAGVESFFGDEQMDTGELIAAGDIFSHEQPAELTGDGVPEWLSEAEDFGEEEPVDEAVTMDTGELIAAGDIFTHEQAEDFGEESAPEWLSGAQEFEEGGDEAEPVAEEEPYEEFPEFDFGEEEEAEELPDLGAEELPDFSELATEGAEELPDLAALGEEAPDWYTSELADLDAPDWFSEAEPTAEPAEELPDILRAEAEKIPGFEGLPTEDEELPDFAAMDEVSPEDEPVAVEADFMADLGFEGEAWAEPDEDFEVMLEGVADDEDLDALFGETADDDEAMDWFAEEIAEAPVAEAAEDSEWLDDLGDIDDLLAAAEADESLAIEAAMMARPEATDPVAEVGASTDDLDSFLAAIDDSIQLPKTDELKLPTNVGFDDLMDEAEDVVGELADTAVPGIEGLSPDAPEWLAAVRVTGEGKSATAAVRQRKERPLSELPDRLQDLHERGLEVRETVGEPAPASRRLAAVLPQLADALAPTAVEAGVPALAAVVDLSIDQHDRVNLLQEVIGTGLEDEVEGEIAPAKVRRRGRRRFNLDRFVIAVLLAGVMFLPFLFGDVHIGRLPGARFGVNSGQRAVFDQVNGLESGQLVLVATEYGPTAAAELDSVTEALLRHVLLRGARPVLVSGNPVGLLHANNVINALADDSDFLGLMQRDQPLQFNHDYYVGRYLAGSTLGLRALGEDPATQLTTNIFGGSTNLPISSIRDFGLLIVIAERADDLRNWAEQVAPLTDAPLVAAASFSAAPLAQPYVDAAANGIRGMLVGYRDAYTYGEMLDALFSGQSLDFVASPTASDTPILPTPTLTDTPTPGEPTDVPTITQTPTRSAATLPAEFTATTVPTNTLTPSDTPTPPSTLTSTPTATFTPSPIFTPTPVIITVGIVNANNTVNVREGPGTNFAAIGVMLPGEEALVIGQNDDGSWINIRLEDGSMGWVAEFLLILEERIETPESAAEPNAGVVVRRSRIHRPLVARSLQGATPTAEGTELETPTATLTPTPTVTPSPTITPSPTPIPETSANRDATPQRDERWYAMTLGLIVSVVIITAGNLFNMLRNLPRRGENS